jgi:aryl-alcohol dehydrogenase-like predicted oxidoreductase
MEYRRLGSSGLKVSAIGLGTNQFGGKVNIEQVKDIIHAAMEVGVNFIDTANVYQDGRSESFIGEAIKGRRDRVLIGTKFFFPTGLKGPNNRGASRHHIIEAVHASLRRLDTDYIDLYQIHQWDEDTPIHETMRTLDDLIKVGSIRYIGASNFSAWQLTHANSVAERMGLTKFISIQPHYHMLERDIEVEIIPACTHLGIGILPYFPLAGGFLTGKYRENEPAPEGSRGITSEYVQRYMTPSNFKILRNLEKFSEQHDGTLTELAHAWLLAQPQISSVISGATKVEHVQANTKSGKFSLNPSDLEIVNKILQGEGS